MNRERAGERQRESPKFQSNKTNDDDLGKEAEMMRKEI